MFELKRFVKLNNVRMLVEGFEDFDFVVNEFFDGFERDFVRAIDMMEVEKIDGFDGNLRERRV